MVIAVTLPRITAYTFSNFTHLTAFVLGKKKVCENNDCEQGVEIANLLCISEVTFSLLWNSIALPHHLLSFRLRFKLHSS
jgi:hypothetical protein